MDTTAMQESMTRLGSALRGAADAMSPLARTVEAAIPEELEARAAGGDPFARRALADAGHPRWAKGTRRPPNLRSPR